MVSLDFSYIYSVFRGFYLLPMNTEIMKLASFMKKGPIGGMV